MIDTTKRAQLEATLRDLGRADARLISVLDAVGPPLPKADPPGFRTLFHTIVAQHVSTASANAVWARLVEAGADDPDYLLTLSDDRLGTLGLTRAKMRCIRAVAGAVVQGDLDLVKMKSDPPEIVMASLTALPGIGRWTAEIYRLFSLGDPDIFPSGDIAIREGIRLMDDLSDRPDAKACDARAEVWRPERSAVTLLLWRLYCVRTGRRVDGVTDDIPPGQIN